MIDPPWDYERDGKRHRGKSPRVLPSDLYPCMTVAELEKLPVGELAEDNSHLYLWATNSFIEEAYKLSRSWGFRPIGLITWVKDRAGVGWYFRGRTEHILFSVRGTLKLKVRNLETVFYAKKMEHSRKPDEAVELIERASYEPRIELFARRKIEGWDVWGNEVESDIKLEINRKEKECLSHSR